MRLPVRIAGTFVVRASAAAASLALAAILVRAYSLEKFGEFSFAYTSVRLVGVFCLFSLDTLMLRLLLRSEQREDAGAVQRLIAACSGTARVLSLGGFLFVTLVAGAVLWAGGRETFWTSILLLSPVVALQAAAALQAALLRAKRRDAWSQGVSYTIAAVVPLALVLGGWAVNATPQYLPEIAVIAGQGAAVACGFALTGLGPWRHLREGIALFARRRLRILRYSSAVHAANLMNHASDWFGALLITIFQSFEAAGVLRIFQQLGSAFGLVGVSLEIPFSTEIARAHIRRRVADLKRLMSQSQVALGIIGALMGGAILIAADLIFALFDLPAAPYRGALLVLIGCYGIVMLTGAAASALHIMDCTRRLVRASTLSFAIAVALQSLLVPFYGVTGAVLGIGLAVAAKAVVNLLSVRAELRARTSIE